jgi:AraC family transcriptional regulator of adaptative response/methylated-DNA-[protein]-cysteine methyltransferase
MEAICRYIDAHADEPLTLAHLGRAAGLSAFELQRRFKATVGVSPRQYAEARRFGALKSALRAGRPVTEAIYAAGFGSSSRVYERTGSRMGMTPRRYGAGGAGLEISYAFLESAIGTVLVAATDRGICAVHIGADRERLVGQLRLELPKAELLLGAGGTGRGTHDGSSRALQLEAWTQSLAAILQGRASTAELPLDLRGTAFQMIVWQHLQQIPRGETRSYGELARAVGRPAAVRAVASACAANRVAVLIPCHRVIRGNGELGGYRWGLERKRALLAAERLPSPSPRR